MGIHISKVNLNQDSMICPSEFIDLNTAGSVYFLKHKPKAEYGNDLDKTVHFSFAVDITGMLKELYI